MKNIFKWILLLLIMWIVITVFYTVGISLYTGALLGSIILTGIGGILYYAIFVRSEKEPEPEPEPEKSNWILRIIVIYIITFFAIFIFEFENTNIGRVILIPGSVFINLLVEYVIPLVEWMFESAEEKPNSSSDKLF